jgi:hypothetical protein
MPAWNEVGSWNDDDFSCVTAADTSLVDRGGVASLRGGSLLKVLTELMASRKTWDVFSLATSSPTSSQVPSTSFFLRNLREEKKRQHQHSRWMFRENALINSRSTNKLRQRYNLHRTSLVDFFVGRLPLTLLIFVTFPSWWPSCILGIGFVQWLVDVRSRQTDCSSPLDPLRRLTRARQVKSMSVEVRWRCR